MPDCFVVMPISDPPNYGGGHFDVVYQHLIRPACESAGFDPIRADEVNQTNYIAIDIIKRIAESDMVVCDLSGRNPNVLYELGIRHTLGKPVTLLKDSKTERIFDIQGIKWVEYDESLRVDKIKAVVPLLKETIENTYASGGPLNSLVGISTPKDNGAIRPEDPPDNKSQASDLEKINGQVVHWDAEAGRGVVQPFNSDESFYVNSYYVAHVGELERGDTVWFVPRPPIIEGKNRLATCVVGKGYFLEGFVSSVGDEFGFIQVVDGKGNMSEVYIDTKGVETPNRGDRVRVEVSSNMRGPAGIGMELLATAS